MIQKLYRWLNSTFQTLPTSFTNLWAPKVICRAADLSPGEYLGLTTFLHLPTIMEAMESGAHRVESSYDGESSMSDIGAQRTEEDLAHAERLIHLCLITKQLWNMR